MIFNKIKSHALIPVVFLLIFACDQTKDSGNVDWVFVKGGNFHQGKNQFIISPMGDTIKNFTSPDRLVKLHDFYISKYEITVGQFRKFSESTGREMPRPPAISAFGDSINFKWKDDFPMLATWDEASEFAKWAGGRLPTEAEWEYAAKGGIQSMNYKYSGSNDAREVGWVFENADSILHPVGKLKPNELGLFDMTGNVNEWVSDWYNPERDDRNDTVNPRGPEYGIEDQKISKGAGWYYRAADANGRPLEFSIHMPEVRYQSPRNTRTYGFGFRVAKDIE